MNSLNKGIICFFNCIINIFIIISIKFELKKSSSKVHSLKIETLEFFIDILFLLSKFLDEISLISLEIFLLGDKPLKL